MEKVSGILMLKSVKNAQTEKAQEQLLEQIGKFTDKLPIESEVHQYL